MYLASCQEDVCIQHLEDQLNITRYVTLARYADLQQTTSDVDQDARWTMP